MKKVIILLISFSYALQTQGDTLSLQWCYNRIDSAFPDKKKEQLYVQEYQQTIKKLNTNYYPQLHLTGKATYQSDVVNFDLDMPFQVDIPSPSRDQYNTNLDIKQMIYDGGRTVYQKKTEQQQLKIHQHEIEVKQLQYRQQIEQTYFLILLLQKHQQQHKILQKDLRQRQQQINAGINNGIFTTSDLLQIKAEILTNEQKIEALQKDIAASYEVLSFLTDSSLNDTYALKLPQIKEEKRKTPYRAEHKLFNTKKNMLEQSKQLINATKRPQIQAFGQIGYGKPGLNFLNEQFDSYYIAGINLSWNIWDWQKSKSAKQKLAIQQEIVDAEKERFDQSLKIKLTQQQAMIEKWESNIVKQKEVVQLRDSISEYAKSKLNNGVITTTDYLIEQHKTTSAKLQLETSKIEYIKAKISYQSLLGNQ